MSIPTAETILFRARVPAERLRKAEEILGRLGMKPGDSLNMLLAQMDAVLSIVAGNFT